MYANEVYILCHSRLLCNESFQLSIHDIVNVIPTPGDLKSAICKLKRQVSVPSVTILTGSVLIHSLCTYYTLYPHIGAGHNQGQQ
jgi:hypothetical protein